MKESHHRRVLRRPVNERKMKIIDNPLHADYQRANLFVTTYGDERHCLKQPDTSSAKSTREQIPVSDDYQAPLSAVSLKHDSKWLIVRRNLHRIRSMGDEKQTPNMYLSFQMIRELKRAQVGIKNIDDDNKSQMKTFSLAVSKQKIKTYDTSHVTSDDALFYDRLGEEP
ncbi:unnamed protein product, partial [Didymodactylos carnosus]